MEIKVVTPGISPHQGQAPITEAGMPPIDRSQQQRFAANPTTHTAREPDELLSGSLHNDLIAHLNSADRISPRNDQLAADPGLRHLVAVHNSFSADRELLLHPLLSSSRKKIEMAAIISRRLYRSGQAATFENIIAALDHVQQRRTVLGSLQVFSDRAVLLAAHDEKLIHSRRNDQKLHDRALRERWIEVSGDANRFGKQGFYQRIKDLMGQRGSFRLIRPEREPDEAAAAATRLIAKHADMIYNFQRYNASSPEIIEFREQLSGAVGLSESARTSITLSLNPRRQEYYIHLEHLGQEVFSASLIAEDGQFSDIIVNRAPGWDYAATLRQSKHDILKAIATTPPGPGGFTFIFDGHGSSDSLYLSGGIPIVTPDRISFATNGATQAISATELAQAIIERNRNYPKQSDDSPDFYLFHCCFSKEFIELVADKIGGQAPVPVMMSCAEHQQFGYSAVAQEMGNTLFQEMLQLRPAWRSTLQEGITLQDLIDMESNRRGRLISNPTIIAPTDEPDPSGLEWEHISSLENNSVFG
jgi:hypothetical protein